MVLFLCLTFKNESGIFCELEISHDVYLQFDYQLSYGYLH